MLLKLIIGSSGLIFSNIAKDNGLDLEVIPNVSYEEGTSDGLFNAWILKGGIK